MASLLSRKSSKPAPRKIRKATVQPAPRKASKPTAVPSKSIGRSVPKPTADPIPSSPVVDAAAIAARYTEKTLRARSTTALKAICKQNKWGPYSTLNKEQLIILIMSNGQRKVTKDEVTKVKAPSVAELKADCKAAGLTGLSKLNRTELAISLEQGAAVKHVAKVGSADWYRSLLTTHKVAGRSKAAGKAGAILLCLTDKACIADILAAGLDTDSLAAWAATNVKPATATKAKAA